ncbi:MAG TPA: hypothetical protein VIT67_15955 [Povalibacter sp.]|jgi:hypothetical protein
MRARSLAKVVSYVALGAASIGFSVVSHAANGVTATHAVVDTVSDAAAFPALATTQPLRTAAASQLAGAQLAVATKMDVGSTGLTGGLAVTPAVAAAPAAAEAQEQGSPEDYLLLTLVGLGLVAYQLLRKHRLLRPQPFSL